MNNPKYIKVENEVFDINTDFRVALECNKIAEDESIGEYERALAIIYKLFGEKGLDCKNQEKLLELSMKYLYIEKEEIENKQEEKDNYELDFEKCEGLIKSSFKFDYQYDPYQLEYLHWYDFYNDLQNLSTSEFGNCCILNRISGILNEKPNEIKDNKQRQQLIDAQKYLKQKYCKTKQKEITKEQEESAKAFYKSLGIDI